ncbi:ABC transporter transmembrane domain-containing protein [Prochlorococcus marinus]|uniref:ABC transporter transmembrane domain-containing protein n=1 Tax=Prochlorococcus marinus TaxID=1219 RepID=UPI0007B32B84|nr:ABC transporter transmembrane domain-containing protein [Prochlorococcus marinus]KZR74883.1 putative multidrug resistance ABC transporter ATP-binding/permease protein YheI [Prochlorococcus marinus str. MIT 1320]
MTQTIHDIYRNEEIPIQRKYRQLMGQDLLTKSINPAFLNEFELVVSFVFFYFGIPLKYSEIDVPELESHAEGHHLLSKYLRDHECIVKHEYFNPDDSTLINSQLLIVFDSKTNLPYVLTKPNGINLFVFDSTKSTNIKVPNLNEYDFKRDVLNITYTDLNNKQSFFDLIKYSAKHLGPIFLVLSLSLVTASVFGIFYPIILSTLINTVIPQGLTNQLLPLSALFVAITAGFVIAQFASIYAFIFADAVIDVRLQVTTFRRLFEMPISFFQSYRSGDLMARAQAITQIRSILSGSFIDTLVHGSIIVTTLLVMIIFSWKLTILIAIITLLYIIFTCFFGFLEAGSKIGELRSKGLNIGYIFNSLKLYTQIKAEKREKLLSNQFGRLIFRQIKSSFRAEMYGQYADLIDVILKTFGLFALFVFGYHLATSTNKAGLTDLNIGKFVAYISLYITYVASLYKLARSISKNASTLNALWLRTDPIFSFDSERLDNEFPLLENICSLRFSNVTFSYPSQTRPLFDNYSLLIEKGATVKIQGGLASGKTTLLNLLLGFDYSSSGSVEINNIDIRSIDLFDLRRKFGVVPQSREILPGFLKDYLLNGSQFTENNVLQTMEALDFLEEFKKYPLGLNTPLAYGGFNFPSAFREMLLITRALLSKPQVFFADDSLLSSDSSLIRNIREYLGIDAIIIITTQSDTYNSQFTNVIQID